MRPETARNFVRDFVEFQPRGEPAVITVSASEGRRVWTFGELVDAAGALAGVFASHGVTRGSTVLTLVGNRLEYGRSGSPGRAGVALLRSPCR